MKRKNDYLLVLISVISILTFATKAKAEGYKFDFEKDLQGQYLDPFVLDAYEGSPPTTIGEIWKATGVVFSTKNTDKSLGLFQSNCIPENGESLTAKEISCGSQNNNGLATGEGSYSNFTKQIEYDTLPHGNILIIEESPGDGIPEDSQKGGTVRLDFDRTILSSVQGSKIGIIDNAQGSIVVQYLNGEKYVKEINQPNENQLEYYTIPDGEIEYIEVNFKGSGGITGVEFDKLVAYVIPNSLADTTISSENPPSSFVTPALIGGGALGLFALLAGGDSGSNSYSVVVPPDLPGGGNNQEVEISPPIDTDISNRPSSPESIMAQINVNSSILTESEFGSIGPMPESNPENPTNPEEPQPVPEPTTVVGTLVALGAGAMMKRKLRKN